MKENIVIIGASSEISKKFQLILENEDFNTSTISRSNSTFSSHLKLNNYIDDIDKIKFFIKDIKNPIVIFFNGFLAENRNTYEPTYSEIANTDYINFQIPYLLTKEINSTLNIKKFIYISTIAATRPRFKNYIYGLSKKKLEESLKFLNLNSFLVIRFGKIETRMSEGHESPPFTISSSQAAKILLKKINKTGIITAGYKIFLAKIIITYFPQKVIDKF